MLFCITVSKGEYKNISPEHTLSLLITKQVYNDSGIVVLGFFKLDRHRFQLDNLWGQKEYKLTKGCKSNIIAARSIHYDSTCNSIPLVINDFFIGKKFFYCSIC